METPNVADELIGILKEFQTLLGHDDADAINPKTCPHGGVKGFLSDLVPTIVRRLARKCGAPLPEDTVIVNIFASEDKKHRLTVEAAAQRYMDRYVAKGGK